MANDEDRDAIHKRRTRLIALALAGMTSAATACGPSVCLSFVEDTGPADAGPEDGGDAGN